MSRTQENRSIGVTTPLGNDVLLLRSMSGSEQLGRLFEYQLDLVSEAPDIDFSQLVGDKMTVRLEKLDGETRYFNGFVSRFSQVGFVGAYTRFRAILVPWFWFLTRNADCRIFQNMTVPDIIKEIFGDRGFSDFEESLTGEYRTWDYCVQYRETDFNFISRLMEQEGIYYYFKQEENLHTMVLSDAYASHEPIPGCEEIPFYPPDDGAIRERDYIDHWTVTHQVKPGIFAHNDFDFEVPRKNLHAKSIIQREHAKSDYEVYDSPGEYIESSDGDSYARIRIEELQSSFETFQGEGNAQGLTVGGLFNLINLPREDQNKEYLVVSTNYQLQSNILDADGADAEGPTFSCYFTTIDAQTPYRPERQTAKPTIQGPQTAIVVGPSGEEIWTDEYARVKVQFHWDRYGESNENSSCWIRVSQIWAGAGWGAMHIPHVGHEVIVEFLEGDPDRPIITGRVYHGNNKPADDLPGEKTKSVNRSFGDNDFVVEDKEGDKHILIKQACGNEIHMHETTPNIEIKQECGNEILMKADGPDIEIKQACGNEILMHEAEGIQIRDKFGNEIVMDAVAGTMKLRSPSHESVIELGKSIWLGTMSDLRRRSDGNFFSVIHGSKDEHVFGPVKVKWDGINAKIHGGLVSDTFYGGQHSSLFGAKITLNAAREVSVNALDRDRKSDGHIRYDSEKFIHLIGGPSDDSQMMLSENSADISSGDDDSISINKGESIQINSSKKIILKADEIILDAKTIKLIASTEISTPKAKIKGPSLDVS